jgi:hypothetical protein
MEIINLDTCNRFQISEPEIAIPRAAVCLAAHNGTHWLPEQMESILAQSEVAVKIFVSVDISTDGTEAWFAENF